MASTSFDIVICVSCKDVFVVRKVVRQIREGNIPECSLIYLITNSRFGFFFSETFCKKWKVIVLNEDEIISGLNINEIRRLVNDHFTKPMRAGWYFQQFLKMAFATTPYSNHYYLIWDADTFPTTPLSFFDEEGKVLFTQKDEYHNPYFETMHKLIGVGKSADFSFIAEHMLVKRDYMLQLIDRIKNSDIDGNNWYEKIIHAVNPDDLLGFSEFETYGTWVLKKYPNEMAFRRLHTMRRAGSLFGRAIKKRELHLFEGVLDTLSVETRDIPPFPRNLYQYAQLAFLYLLRP